MTDILKYAEFPANYDYHANERVSCTGFKVFLESAFAFKHRFMDGNDIGSTPAMKLGSLIHCFVLTPSLINEEFRVREKMPLSKKEDKARFIDHLIAIGCADPGEESTLMECKADELRELENGTDFDWITQEDMDHGKRIADVVRPWMPAVTDTLDPETANTEAAFFATVEGVKIQCKADLIDRNTQTVWDIKATADLPRWIRGLSNGYQLIGDAFYRLVIKEATGTLIEPIRYVGVSTKEPHDVVIRYHPPELYELAEAKVIAGLKRFAECRDSGVWPGIDGTDIVPKMIEVKSWVYDELEADGLPEKDWDDIFGPIIMNITKGE